jgi:hypothetical protein
MFAGARLCSHAFFNISRTLLSAFSSSINAATSLPTPFTSSLNLLATWRSWMVRLTRPTMPAARLNGSPIAKAPRAVDDLVLRRESAGTFSGGTHSLIHKPRTRTAVLVRFCGFVACCSCQCTASTFHAGHHVCIHVACCVQSERSTAIVRQRNDGSYAMRMLVVGKYRRDHLRDHTFRT